MVLPASAGPVGGLGRPTLVLARRSCHRGGLRSRSDDYDPPRSARPAGDHMPGHGRDAGRAGRRGRRGARRRRGGARAGRRRAGGVDPGRAGRVVAGSARDTGLGRRDRPVRAGCGAGARRVAVWRRAARVGRRGVSWAVLHATAGLAETGVAVVAVACRRERDTPRECGRGSAAASAPPRAGALCRAGHGGLAGAGLSHAVGASGGSACLCRDGSRGVARAGTGHPPSRHAFSPTQHGNGLAIELRFGSGEARARQPGRLAHRCSLIEGGATP